MTQAAAREDARPLLTPTEVAELANVSRKIVYCEIDRGELRRSTLAGCCASTRPTSTAGEATG